MFTYSLCLQYESSNFTIGEWKFILSTKFRKEKKKKNAKQVYDSITVQESVSDWGHSKST